MNFDAGLKITVKILGIYRRNWLDKVIVKIWERDPGVL